MRGVVALLGILAAVAVLVMISSDPRGGRGAAVEGPSELPPVEGAPSWDDTDWTIFQTKVRWAVDQGLDTVPLGRAIADIGRSLVGTPYVPRTLEADGPEHVVIDFRGLDCVTFVENSFALARFVRSGGARLLSARVLAEDRYEQLLTELRYRDGRLDGYPSRLHYFSDWIADNARRGLVRDLDEELGGVSDPEAVDFMSTHVDAYRQLGDSANLTAIRDAERRLTERGRRYIPEDRIAGIADSIQDGDIIAATSTVKGLDIAHTGIAYWTGGALHLLHAPLVGDSVQVSDLPLAERILGIGGQDGIMVARPLEHP